MGLDLVVSPLDSNGLGGPRSGKLARRPQARLCSRIRGRERWRVDILEDNPRLAAAVELVLQTEEGVIETSVNPETGGVLVRYDPEAIISPIEALLRRAVKASPLTAEEFSVFRAKRLEADLHAPLLKVEAGCLLFRMIVLGGLCPVGLTCAAVLFLGDLAKLSRRRAKTASDYSESVATN